jgi:hypothetical protein
MSTIRIPDRSETRSEESLLGPTAPVALSIWEAPAESQRRWRERVEVLRAELEAGTAADVSDEELDRLISEELDAYRHGHR